MKMTGVRDLSEVSDGEKITVQATVYGVPYVQRYGRNKSRMVCKVVISGIPVSSVWFNRHFLKDRLRPGLDIILPASGMRAQQLTVSESEFPGAKEQQSGTLQPVYSVSSEVSQKWLRKIIRQGLEQYGEMIEEILPPDLVSKHHLPTRREAIFRIHYAENTDEGQSARKRMVYEELLLFQLKLQALKALNRQKTDGIQHPIDMEQVKQFIRSLPFTLTNAQKQVISEILHDLRQPYCMNRLLQGDVGAGKTVVAAMALFAAVSRQSGRADGADGNSGRAACPFAEAAVRAVWHSGGLLVGSLTDARRDILAALQMGMIGHRGRHTCADSGGRLFSPARACRNGRAAPLRRESAQHSAAQRDESRRADDDRHADPAHAGDYRVRRYGCVDAARAAEGAQADQDVLGQA